MTRPVKSKILYAIVLAGLLGIAYIAGRQFNFQPNALLVMALCILAPGRITSYCWREFYAGHRLMQKGEYEKAKGQFESFLGKTQSSPWLKKLIFFKWGFYTWDIEAMTLNNLGSSSLSMDEVESASQYFNAATTLDPLFPMPYVNLAIISYAKGDDEQCERLLAQSRSLGFSQIDEPRTKKVAMEIRSRLNSKV